MDHGGNAAGRVDGGGRWERDAACIEDQQPGSVGVEVADDGEELAGVLAGGVGAGTKTAALGVPAGHERPDTARAAPGLVPGQRPSYVAPVSCCR